MNKLLKSSIKYFKILILSLMVVVLIFIGYVYLLTVIDQPYGKVKFDSIAWRENKQFKSWRHIRICMVDDLGKNYLKKGVSKDSLLSLLGEPMEINNDSSMYKYPLGARRYMIDGEFLKLYFDNNGRLLYSKIKRR